MAAVIYECGMCKHFWGDVAYASCPKCGSTNIQADWVEAKDFAHPELNGFPDRDYDSDNDHDVEC